MTFGSLFSGIGGLDLGLERAGFECRFQVEIDPFCRKVLENHWPGVKRYEDITKLDGSELEPVDLLCGGFPCQDLSQAGKRAGIEGTRSGLWFEFARLIRVLRPRYVVIENVPGILTNRGAMDAVLGKLARLGYVGSWLCLRASDFGASHLRKRVFIVAQLARRKHTGRLERSAAHNGNGHHASRHNANGCDPTLGNTASARREKAGIGRDLDAGGEPEAGCGILADAQCAERRPQGRNGAGSEEPFLEFAPGPGDPRWPAILRERPDLAPALEPPICRVASRLSDRLDGALKDRTKRLSRLGNSVVPQCAQWIGERILKMENL